MSSDPAVHSSDSAPAPETPAAETSAPEPTDHLSVTHHRLSIGGREWRYTATAGTLVLRDEAEQDGVSQGPQPRAQVFFVAYTLEREGGEADQPRPLTFSFNGGPGSSSVWLHLGLLGPRRVVMGDAGALSGPPYTLTDNEFSLLEVSDLVFIDPVSTGYSRASQGQKPGDFHGFTRDVQLVGDFIRLYTSRAQRWLSPKFLIGESYGTTRAAALSGYLQERHGLFLNGLMLVSSILDFGSVDFTPGHDLAYPLHLPSYSAVAWYHGQLPGGRRRGLAAVLREAEAFADGEYSRALHLGARLSAAQRRGVAETLARLTGLSADFVLAHDLRVPLAEFRKELLRGQGRSVGRLDGRFTGLDRRVGGQTPDFDPSLSAIQGPYTAAINHLLSGELGYTSDLPYEVLTSRVQPWSYREFENRHVRVSDTLRAAMHQSPHLKVYVGSGYYDFATPYHATRHALDHLGLDPSLRGNVREHFYEAGHMMYVHAASLARQAQDLRAFVAWAKGGVGSGP